MTAEGFNRKLTAIFSADVVGYSRLMGEDEPATIETLTSHKEIMGELIQQYKGRVVDSTGDNLMAEFGSVVDAVQCAVEIQQVLRSKNNALDENRRMFFRIGINLGDVIEESDRIYGDGVNIAARVESLADKGGISISGTAYDQLGKKLPLGYEYLGEQTVKNIERPVRVYRVLTEAKAAGKVIDKKKSVSMPWRWAAMAIAIVILAVGALSVWKVYLQPDIEPASVEKMAFPLPDKPSIAVLPFDNLSGDPEQEYIADGISENVISTLSKVSIIFVTARNSTFAYKDKPVKIRQVAEELGVRYVLEGSVQKSGDRLRVTAQLIDAINGHHLWSEKYDRKMKDFFDLQDEITKKIVIELQVEIGSGETNRMFLKSTDNFDAWTNVAKGIKLCMKYNKKDNIRARALFEAAIELDPEYAEAWAWVANSHKFDAQFGWSESRIASMKRAHELAQKALAMDDKRPASHLALGQIYEVQRQFEKAINEYRIVISLDPNHSPGHALLASTMNSVGEFEESITLMKTAMRLSPYYGSWYLAILCRAYFFTGRYEKAIAVCNQWLDRCRRGECSTWKPLARLAEVYAELGKVEEARAFMTKALEKNPKLSLASYRRGFPFKNPAHLQRLLYAASKAGLPDKPPLPLPDKPSIAVLPFTNMSGDPEQEYFSDGITEEIITALSKVPQLFVIARNSSFTYKGKPVKVQNVGRELGVKYVLEGSVRKEGDKIRVTAQLIEAKTGNHLWAERYDRDLKDIFALQDEITVKIMSALRVKLVTGGEVAAQKWQAGTKSLQAYLKGIEALHYLARGTPDDYALALKLSEEAIVLDPEYVPPYMILAWTHILGARLGTSKSPRESMGKAFKLAQKVVAMDESDARARTLLSIVYRNKGEYERAISESERAVTLDPNYDKGYMGFAEALIIAGRPQEAIPLLKKSMRLSPLDQTHASMCLFRLGWAYRIIGQYEEALSALKKAVEIRPNFFAIHLQLAATFIELGREEEARAAAAEVRRILPKYSLERSEKRSQMKDPAHKKRYYDALREAGL